MDKLKKTLLYLLVIILVLGFWHWIVSLGYCEYLTRRYVYEFWEVSQEDTMLIAPSSIKVLQYSKTSAQIYYITEDSGSGNILHLSKSYISNVWTVDSWETVWSTTGSADGVVWPYIR